MKTGPPDQAGEPLVRAAADLAVRLFERVLLDEQELPRASLSNGNALLTV